MRHFLPEAMFNIHICSKKHSHLFMTMDICTLYCFQNLLTFYFQSVFPITVYSFEVVTVLMYVLFCMGRR